jgi:pimeloyl-ACP methyl ester carboxylesterase
MKRWLGRIATGILALVTFLAIAGATYEALARQRVVRQFPLSGRLVDVGGRRIQLDCRGNGSPVVVFESGRDLNGSLSWFRVQDEVATTNRACSYSRAGILWSDPSNGPHTGRAAVFDLHAALQRAGERPPFILVGHSVGGPYVLTYTKYFGSEVAGLVLVDPSHPEQFERIRSITPANPTSVGTAQKLLIAFSWTGITRLLAPQSPPPEAPRALQTIAAFGPTSFVAAVKETEADSETFADAGTLRNLGARPVFVLTAMQPYSAEFLQAFKLSPQQGHQFQALWKSMHDEEASWSSVNRHQLVPDSGHYIQLEKPELVISAIRWVSNQIRTGQ